MGQEEKVKGHACWLLIVGLWQLVVDIDVDSGDGKDIQIERPAAEVFISVYHVQPRDTSSLAISSPFHYSFPSHHIHTQEYVVEVTYDRRSPSTGSFLAPGEPSHHQKWCAGGLPMVCWSMGLTWQKSKRKKGSCCWRKRWQYGKQISFTRPIANVTLSSFSLSGTPVEEASPCSVV